MAYVDVQALLRECPVRLPEDGAPGGLDARDIVYLEYVVGRDPVVVDVGYLLYSCNGNNWNNTYIKGILVPALFNNTDRHLRVVKI